MEISLINGEWIAHYQGLIAKESPSDLSGDGFVSAIENVLEFKERHDCLVKI